MRVPPNSMSDVGGGPTGRLAPARPGCSATMMDGGTSQVSFQVKLKTT